MFLKLKSNSFLRLITVVRHTLIFFAITVSMLSSAEELFDWEPDKGAFTLMSTNSSLSHWNQVQTKLIVEGESASIYWYLAPKNHSEACKFGYSDKVKNTAIVVNGEVLGAQASCHQDQYGTFYAISVSSPAYFESVIKTFKESSRVKIEHDIASFNVSAIGFTKVWDIKAADYKAPIFIDLLADYREQAKNGDIKMQDFLGFCYASGEDPCPLDYNIAFKWSEMAALRGSPSSQMTLGKMYGGGHGVVKDFKESIKWFRKAAEQGQAAAQFYLATYYARGDGVIKDEVTAHMWFNISAANGFDKARKPLELMEQFMSQRALEEAFSLARQCVQNNYKRC